MDVAREPRRVSRLRQPWLVGCGVGALLLASSWLLLSQLSAAAPRVERGALWIDSVQRGELLREVSGPGTLVPERVRIVTLEQPGRVASIFAQPGDRVEADTVLLELENPDLELRALEAERELKSAEADHVNLRASLEIEQLGQESKIAQIRLDQREAKRQAEAGARLAQSNVIGSLELTRRQERAQELAGRLATEQRRAEILKGSMRTRLTASEAKVDRLRALAEFRRAQVEALHVRAGQNGVLQELGLEVGERVAAGEVLAKVTEPRELKAEVRIPEAQAEEIRAGQPATIDTRNGIVHGRVSRIDPAVQQGTVTVDVEILEPLPSGSRPEQSVDGRIELERLNDVLYVGRPAFGRANSATSLFVLDDTRSFAERVTVQLGASSVSNVQVVEGLREGDRVILSDMSEWDSVSRVDLE